MAHCRSPRSPRSVTSLASSSSPCIDFTGYRHSRATRIVVPPSAPDRRGTLASLTIGEAPGRAAGGLLVAEGDAGPREIVRRQLDLHAVSGQYPDAVLAHLSAQVAEYVVTVVEHDAEV